MVELFPPTFTNSGSDFRIGALWPYDFISRTGSHIHTRSSGLPVAITSCSCHSKSSTIHKYYTHTDTHTKTKTEKLNARGTKNWGRGSQRDALVYRALRLRG